MPGLGVGAWGNSVALEGGVIVNAGAPGPGSFVPSAPAEVYGSGGGVLHLTWRERMWCWQMGFWLEERRAVLMRAVESPWFGLKLSSLLQDKLFKPL